MTHNHRSENRPTAAENPLLDDRTPAHQMDREQLLAHRDAWLDYAVELYGRLGQELALRRAARYEDDLDYIKVGAPPGTKTLPMIQYDGMHAPMPTSISSLELV